MIEFDLPKIDFEISEIVERYTIILYKLILFFANIYLSVASFSFVYQHNWLNSPETNQ